MRTCLGTQHLYACLLVFLAVVSGVESRSAPRPAAAPASPKLVSIAVAPSGVELIGPRAEHGLVVTAQYSDSTLRDVTSVARYLVDNPRVVSIARLEGRRVLRPLADGTAQVTATVAGAAPALVQVHVRDSGETAPVSFRAEVVPALTKVGCNQGLCHGTPTGKGGFRLSLQGFAPDADYQTIVREGGGRRVNKADPGRSLVLLKPLVQMPHAGGKRLSPEMPEYDILVRWITEGAHDDPPEAPRVTKLEILPGRRTLRLPGAKQQIEAVAHFSDGTARSVTRVAKLSSSDEDTASVTREGLVEGLKRGDAAILVRYQDQLASARLTFLRDVPGFAWKAPPEANFIDRNVFARLKLFQIPVSDLSADAEFLRRAYLDAIGTLPSADETRAFLRDPSPDRRTKVIDALTQRPEFADFWALKWSDVLRVQDESLREGGARNYHRWIRESLAANKPLDQFVREILTSSGQFGQQPAASYYRALRDVDEQIPAATLSQATAQLFMGVRIICAKCHNHPFERWTQDEYYELAAFFAQVRTSDGSMWLDPNGEVAHLRTGQTMRPKLLGAEFPKLEPGEDRRTALAHWLTRKDNPFFAKSVVNRVWSHLLGRGIVEPIDDFRESNPPANEELLEGLARDFRGHDFNFRHLVRTIMSSRTYQLSARPLPLNHDDARYFSHAYTHLLTAEQLLDAICQVTGRPEEFAGYPAGTRAIQIAGTRGRTPFMKTFGRPDRNLVCECERDKDPTLFQALALISSREIEAKLTSEQGRIAALAATDRPPADLVEELYLSALCRLPSARERARWTEHFAKAPSRRRALEDLGWVLINSKEFQFRH